MNEHTPACPAWIGQGIPARLTMESAGKMLGFSIAEMRYLLAEKHLKVLGKPTQQHTKYLATVYVIQLAQDEAWLKKATELSYRGNGTKSQRLVKERLAA